MVHNPRHSRNDMGSIYIIYIYIIMKGQKENKERKKSKSISLLPFIICKGIKCSWSMIGKVSDSRKGFISSQVITLNTHNLMGEIDKWVWLHRSYACHCQLPADKTSHDIMVSWIHERL